MMIQVVKLLLTSLLIDGEGETEWSEVEEITIREEEVSTVIDCLSKWERSCKRENKRWTRWKFQELRQQLTVISNPLLEVIRIQPEMFFIKSKNHPILFLREFEE